MHLPSFFLPEIHRPLIFLGYKLQAGNLRSAFCDFRKTLDCGMERVSYGEPSYSVSELLWRAAAMIPMRSYVFGVFFLLLVFLYNFLEFHLFKDLFRGFKGDPVTLTFHPGAEIYEDVVSKCKILHGRYLPTPWILGPHLQTAFLNFFGRPPVFEYTRQIFNLPDGGTIALDWLLPSDVSNKALPLDKGISQDETTPMVMVIPGLTSDSHSAYIKHLAFQMAKGGWNVVVYNHRGLGGVSITSDCFYNAGWTEDVRRIINYLHEQNPKAPLFSIGTSIGANVLVKYLGEEGENTPIAGAAAICSPWDLVVCDRFISRRLVQRLYDRALTIGLQGYAQLHEPTFARLANWEGIKKSRSVRDFDNHATRLVGKYETVDSYYRHCSSVSYVGNVSVPLLCISSLDDPVCTKEAIPWDECRGNKKIVLATTTHGGHLGFFKGITADTIWWVQAVDEYLNILHCSQIMHKPKKIPSSELHSSLESSIDKGPYINVMEDGMVSAIGNEPKESNIVAEYSDNAITLHQEDEIIGQISDQNERTPITDFTTTQTSEENSPKYQANTSEVPSPITRCIHQLSRQSQRSIWLLAYIAIMTSWPLVGSVLFVVFRKKLRNILPPTWLRR